MNMSYTGYGADTGCEAAGSDSTNIVPQSSRKKPEKRNLNNFINIKSIFTLLRVLESPVSVLFKTCLEITIPFFLEMIAIMPKHYTSRFGGEKNYATTLLAHLFSKLILSCCFSRATLARRPNGGKTAKKNNFAKQILE